MGASTAVVALRRAVESGPVVEQTDDRLVARVRAGDETAFEAIYDRYARGVLAFCVHVLGSREEAEDALQLTFVSAYRALRRSQSEIVLRPWLYTIARNRCVSQLRALREDVDLDGVLADRPAPAGLTDQVQRREDFRDMLDDMQRLPDDQRAALVLFELGDHSHREIAAVLGVRTDKVKALIYQAREGLLRGRRARERSCRDPRVARELTWQAAAAEHGACPYRSVPVVRGVRGRGRAPARRLRADPARGVERGAQALGVERGVRRRGRRRRCGHGRGRGRRWRGRHGRSWNFVGGGDCDGHRGPRGRLARVRWGGRDAARRKAPHRDGDRERCGRRGGWRQSGSSARSGVGDGSRRCPCISRGGPDVPGGAGRPGRGDDDPRWVNGSRRHPGCAPSGWIVGSGEGARSHGPRCPDRTDGGTERRGLGCVKHPIRCPGHRAVECTSRWGRARRGWFAFVGDAGRWAVRRSLGSVAWFGRRPAYGSSEPVAGVRRRARRCSEAPIIRFESVARPGSFARISELARPERRSEPSGVERSVGRPERAEPNSVRRCEFASFERIRDPGRERGAAEGERLRGCNRRGERSQRRCAAGAVGSRECPAWPAGPGKSLIKVGSPPWISRRARNALLVR